MKTALLTIDIQNSFLHRPYYRDNDMPAFSQAVTQIVNAAQAAKVPVVRAHHVEAEGAFSIASGYVRPMAWLPAHHDVLIEKHVHNAFTDTGLDRWLRERDIKRVMITGIRTEQCCETTTRVASDLGYEVDYVTEATLTFPMTHANGTQFTAAQIKERTELVLAERFATICSLSEALRRLK